MTTETGSGGGSAPNGTAADPKLASWHMKTGGMPQSQRFEAWRAWNARACDMLPLQDQPGEYRSYLSVWPLADLIVCRSGSTGYRAARRSGHIRDYRQRWLRLRVMERGHAKGVYGNHPGHLDPGDVQIIDLADEYRSIYGETDYVTVFVPQELVGLSPRDMKLPKTLRSQSPICRVLADATRSLVSHMSTARAADAAPLAAGFTGLLSGLVFGGEIDEPANTALRQSRRHAIEAHIERHLNEPEVDVAELSLRFGASRATIYRLFADEGGVQAYAMRRRLEQAYRDLTAHPPTRGIVRTVREKWGFQDHSHFTRAFRERFGLSPSDAAQMGTASADRDGPPAIAREALERSLLTPDLFLQM